MEISSDAESFIQTRLLFNDKYLIDMGSMHISNDILNYKTMEK